MVSWDGKEMARDGDKRSRYFQLEGRDAHCPLEPPRQFQAATKELAAEWLEHLEKAAGMQNDPSNLRLILSPPNQHRRHGEEHITTTDLSYFKFQIQRQTQFDNSIALNIEINC